MCKKIIFTVGMILILAGAVLFILCPEELRGAIGGIGRITIVVDPGHGGIDGGAESSGGICEKDINLAISMKVKEKAEEEGWYVLMTREEDTGLYSEEKGSIRSKKNEDLKKRQEIINNSGADAAVSIHLNSYPSQQVKGAQTFYSSSSEEGKVLAELIQEKIRKELDETNERTALPKDDIIIMKNNTCPLVLVECGFLSNREESKKLMEESYQDIIADIIVCSMKEHFLEIGKLKKEEVSVILSE
ncbi:MAG: N-acetylmuramoyl-L-alanine amidase CwlD [Firmicutes bacterium]|nr:N-acetylmuramoyl-L-alanine amidase CwlD [Bacillota bacterium]